MGAEVYVTNVSRVFAGAALVLFSNAALADEAKITDAEKPLARAALCKDAKKPVATTEDMKACQAYIEARNAANNWKPEEQMKSIEAVCRQRYKGDPISMYETCRTELGVAYNLLAVKVGADGKREVSYVDACGKGLAVAVVGAVILQGGAFVADLFGCAGFCSAGAAKVNAVGLPAIAAAGCAGGIATAIVMSDGSTGQQPQRVPAVPRLAPGK